MKPPSLSASSAERIAYELNFHAEGFQTTLLADRIAVDPQGQLLYVLSFAAPATAAKAVFANLLADGVGVAMRLDVRPDHWPYGHSTPRKFFGGYRQYRHYLGHGTWHYLLVAKKKGLLTSLSDDALWNELQSDRYTTPLLKAWMPTLRSIMAREGQLTKCLCVDCDAGILDCSPEKLDSIVEDGLRGGHLLLEDAA